MQVRVAAAAAGLAAYNLARELRDTNSEPQDDDWARREASAVMFAAARLCSAVGVDPAQLAHEWTTNAATGIR